MPVYSNFNINNPPNFDTAILDSVAYQFGSECPITYPMFLRTPAGSFSNRTPTASDRAGEISTVVAYNETGELDEWDIQVFINGSVVFTGTKTAGLAKKEFTGLAIAVGLADLISVKLDNPIGVINSPSATVIVKNL